MVHSFVAIVVFCITSNLIHPSRGRTIQTEDHIEKRCTKPECDSTNALSYCGPIETLCNSGHEEAPSGWCKDINKRCCRTACHGHLSYCFLEGVECLPGHIAVEGKCPVSGFKCCAPNDNVSNKTIEVNGQR